MARRCACQYRALPVVVEHHDYLLPMAGPEGGSDEYCTCTCHLEAISGAPCGEPTMDAYEYSYRPADTCWDVVV